MISISIIGHLGKDAEVKEINNQKVISFNVAHSHSYKNAQGVKMESTTWVRCEMWAQKDALSPYLKKGTLVYAQGIPKAYGYKNDQQQIVANLQMRVDNVQLLGGAKAPANNNATPSTAEAEPPATVHEGMGNGIADDLPF